MNKLQTTALLGLGLGLALQAAPAAAWWQTYSQTIPYGPTTGMAAYPTSPWIPNYGPNLSALWDFLAPLSGLGGPQFWQYPNMAYGPTALWSAAMPMGGLYVQQNEVPAGYQIRVQTGQPGLPVVDISVQWQPPGDPQPVVRDRRRQRDVHEPVRLVEPVDLTAGGCQCRGDADAARQRGGGNLYPSRSLRQRRRTAMRMAECRRIKGLSL